MSIREGGLGDGGGGGRGRSELFPSSFTFFFGFGFWLWASLFERLALGFSLGISLGFTLGGLPFFFLSSTEGFGSGLGRWLGALFGGLFVTFLHGERPEFWLSRRHGLRYRPLSAPCRQGILRFFTRLRRSVIS